MIYWKKLKGKSETENGDLNPHSLGGNGARRRTRCGVSGLRAVSLWEAHCLEGQRDKQEGAVATFPKVRGCTCAGADGGSAGSLVTQGSSGEGAGWRLTRGAGRRAVEGGALCRGDTEQG